MFWGHGLVVVAAEKKGLVDVEQFLGKTVDGGDPVLLVQGDDPGGHVLENDLGIASSLF